MATNSLKMFFNHQEKSHELWESILDNASLNEDGKRVIKMAEASPVVEQDVLAVELQVWLQCLCNCGAGSRMPKTSYSKEPQNLKSTPCM